MAKMFTEGFKPKSTTKKAKQLIRSEALSRYDTRGGGYSDNLTRLQRMKRDAEAYDGGVAHRYPLSDYTKGAALVDAGCYRCYYDDQREFLAKIYGKKNVEAWSNDKVHATYKHLIGREYDAMLREKEKQKQAKAASKKRKG